MNPTFFSQVIAPFAAHANGWTAPILALGTPIFWMLATLELCIVFALIVVNHDIPGMVDDLMRSVIGIGIGCTIFQNAADWGAALARTIAGIGGQVAGFGSTLSSDGIMAYGYTMASTLWSSVSLGIFPVTAANHDYLLDRRLHHLRALRLDRDHLIITHHRSILCRHRRFDLFTLRRLPLYPSAGRRVAELDPGRGHADLCDVPDPEHRPANDCGMGELDGWLDHRCAGSFISPIPYTSNFLNPFLVLAQTFIFWALAVKMLLIMRHKVDGII